MPKISIVLPTARESHPLFDLPNDHIFDRTLESLRSQTFKDFELIVVDALIDEERTNRTKAYAGSFPIVHIPPKANPWHERGLWAVASQFNTGLRYARGPLVVTIGDCSELPPHLLQRFWDLYEEGFLSQAIIRYYRGGQPLIGADAKPVLDSRTDQVIAAGELDASLPNWWYGYGAAPLEAYLTVNGFDEAFDGTKSLEDCDLGSRFAMAGYTKLRLAHDLWAIEHAHGPISPRICRPYTFRDPPPSGNVIVQPGSAKAMKCNYAIYRYNQTTHRVRANTGPLPKDALDFIRTMSRSSECSHVNGEDYDLGEGFDWWAANVPSFDLRTERSRTLAAQPIQFLR